MILQRTGAGSSFRHMQTPRAEPFQARSVAWVEGSIVILLTGNTGSIYRSIDNGGTWTSVYSQSNSLHTITSKDGICVAAGEYGAIIISKDKGVTWTAIRIKQAKTLRSVSIQEIPSRCAGNGGTIVTSKWCRCYPGEPPRGLVSDDLRFITFLDDSKGFIGGTSGSLFDNNRRKKLGWVYSLIHFFISEMCFQDNSTGIAMGNTGILIEQWTEVLPEYARTYPGYQSMDEFGGFLTVPISLPSEMKAQFVQKYFVDIESNTLLRKYTFDRKQCITIWVASENGSINRSG